MSWGTRWTQDNGNIVDESVEELQNSLSHVLKNEEHTEQYEQAVKVADDIIKSGVVGDPDGKFYVSFSGHGNPNHEPQAGWANDSLTVTVTQL